MFQGNNMTVEKRKTKNFIEHIIDSDLSSSKVNNVVTRFPPEPNGHLHIGHAKSICLNFNLKEKYTGKCNLRFDDTNPLTEDIKYVESIKKDIQWLGYSWDELRFASEYFDELYGYAVILIKNGFAYVDSLSEEEVRFHRGNHTTPGKNSPFRDRSVEENLKLFEEMKSGKYSDGEHILRAKINMSSDNMNLRDPILYRIRKDAAPISGKKWYIYPLYDFAHTLSDTLEGISHSLCTLEFEDHKPLYNWFLEKLKIRNPPQQIEFSKLLLSDVVLSKRNLKLLVDERHVDGWDDPRMPTISGLRRRGYTPNSIKSFCSEIGISKSNSMIDFALLEENLRLDLDPTADRKFAVINPLKVVLTNYDKIEMLEAPNHPKFPERGFRQLYMEKELWIERDDFFETAPKDFKRLVLGGEVRLRYSYVIRCNEVIKDNNSRIIELRCTVDLDTLGKKPTGRKVNGVIHWLPVHNSIPITANFFENLFLNVPSESFKEKKFTDFINPKSRDIKIGWGENSLKNTEPGQKFQFERVGYFSADDLSTVNNLVFNRTTTLLSNHKN